MKSLSKKTNKALGEDEQFNKGQTIDETEDGSAPDMSGGKQGAPRRKASLVMQAVAKAVQNTPGKKGKKATRAPKGPSEPSTDQAETDFDKSSKNRNPAYRSKKVDKGDY